MAVHARALHGDAWDPWPRLHGVQPVPGVWPQVCMWGCTPPAAEPSWPAASSPLSPSSPLAREAPGSPASTVHYALTADDAETARNVRLAVGREPPVEATLLEPPVGGGPDSAEPARERALGVQPELHTGARLVQATPPETGGRPDVRGLYEELAAAGLSPKLFWWQCPEWLAMVTAIESWRQRALGVQPELHTARRMRRFALGLLLMRGLRGHRGVAWLQQQWPKAALSRAAMPQGGAGLAAACRAAATALLRARH